MKIESIIRRAKGTTVSLGSMTYRFAPENDHVCNVDDEAHIERFLSIKEGFRKAANQSVPANIASDAPADQDAKPASGEIDAEPKKRGGRKPKAVAESSGDTPADQDAPAGEGNKAEEQA